MSHIKPWNRASGTTKTESELSLQEKAAIAREIFGVQSDNARLPSYPAVDRDALEKAQSFATDAGLVDLGKDIGAMLAALPRGKP